MHNSFIIKIVHSHEFAAAYPFDITEEEIHKGEHSQFIKDGQVWSYKFGRRLHCALTGRQPDTFVAPGELREYRAWGEAASERMITLMETALKHHAALRAMNEFNFNLLNFFMRSMWEPVFRGDWTSEGGRMHYLQQAEQSLAFAGYRYVWARQLQVDRHGSAKQLLDENGFGAFNRTITGILQEIDSAIILLATVRSRPSWTVVPAPVNFEQMGRGNNVDFVVTDCRNQRTVGIQVKTNLQPRTVRRADPRRVVFIDGTKDLCNVSTLPSHDATSIEVAWPGLIAVRYLAQLPKGKAQKLLNRYVRANVERLAAEARIEIDEPIRLIEERLLQRM